VLAENRAVLQEGALTVFVGTTGPKDWTINTDARLAAVVAHKGKMVELFGYTSPYETDVPVVIKMPKKSVSK
jgi:hypothetical protein